MNSKTRKLMLKEMRKIAGKYYERICPFLNNDVPIFLKKMEKFEKRSKRKKITAKFYRQLIDTQ